MTHGHRPNLCGVQLQGDTAVVYTIQNTVSDKLNRDLSTTSKALKTSIINSSYLIVIGDCEKSPTDLYINKSNSSYDFSIVEESCSEEMGGPGVLVYANTRLLDADWFQTRHSLTKRLQGRLISTIYVSKRTENVFV